MRYSCAGGDDTGHRQKLARGPGECEVCLQRQIQSAGSALHMDQVSFPKTSVTSSQSWDTESEGNTHFQRFSVNNHISGFGEVRNETFVIG